MRDVEINQRSLGNNTEWVDVKVGLEIMVNDVEHVHSILDTWHLVELAGVCVEIWVVTQTLLAGFEVDCEQGIQTLGMGDRPNMIGD